MVDLVNHPPHYKGNRFESIDIIEAYRLGFHLGNALKYIVRHKKKNGRQDLEKALWYLNRFWQIEMARETQIRAWSADLAFSDDEELIADDFEIELGSLRNAMICILRAARYSSLWRITQARDYVQAALSLMPA